MLSKTELYLFLQKQYDRLGSPLPEEGRIGLKVQELVDASIERSASKDLPFVDLWIAILDELISSLISFMSTTQEKMDSELSLQHIERKFYNSITLILMENNSRLNFHTHLINLGYDTSARTILRSTSEYMELLVAIIDDPSFAEPFNESDTPEGAHKFWRTHLRGPMIRARVKQAWTRFAGNDEADDEAAAEWFSRWGSSSHRSLSGILHPSFAGGMFTAIPFKQAYDDENWLGVWGDRSEGSVETIYIYSHFMFPILLLSPKFPFEVDHPEISPVVRDDENELHKHVGVGRSALGTLILPLGTENNTPHVFPEYDMSIWREDQVPPTSVEK